MISAYFKSQNGHLTDCLTDICFESSITTIKYSLKPSAKDIPCHLGDFHLINVCRKTECTKIELSLNYNFTGKT